LLPPALLLPRAAITLCLQAAPALPADSSAPRLPAPSLPLPPRQVSAIYKSVPYHNFHHCVDVTHTTFMFIK
jgi:hypothetical protein